MSAQDPQRREWRPLLRRIHSWIGLVLCVPLALLGITGSILVFQDEIERMLAPELHHASAGTPQSPGAILAAAEEAARGKRPAVFMAPSGPGDSAAVRFGDRGAGSVDYFVDPVSLAILGHRDGAANPLRLVHALHENLASGREGRMVVGWLGVAMTLLCITGPFLWWPRDGRWRKALVVQSGATGYRFLRELHGMFGIWGVAAFAVVSATGIYLGFPQTISHAVGAIAPTSPPIFELANTKVTPVAGVTPLDLDGAVALARQTEGSAHLRFVALPQRQDQPIRVSFMNGGAFSQIVVDPWRREIAARRDSNSPGDRILATLRALHVGSTLGWPYRLLVFAVGFLPPLFAVTGVAMWVIKRRRRASASATAGAPAE